MEEMSGRSVYLQQVLPVCSLGLGQGQLQTRHEQPTHLRLMMVPWTVPCPDTKSVPGGKASASAHSVSIMVLQDPA